MMRLWTDWKLLGPVQEGLLRRLCSKGAQLIHVFGTVYNFRFVDDCQLAIEYRGNELQILGGVMARGAGTSLGL